MRIVFAGTPDFAAVSLKRLINEGFDVVAVYTQPDRASGRNRQIVPSPVKQLALEHNIAIEQPKNFKEQSEIEKFASYKADIFIVAAYGLILPTTLLEICPKNINIHASLLPKWRGAAPIQYALMNGDNITGICLMEIVKELDAGPVISQASIAIRPEHNLASLSQDLSHLGAELLVTTLPKIEILWPARLQQLSEFKSYAPKITKADALIDWQQPATKIVNQIRALATWPKAYFIHNGNAIKIIDARVSEHKATAAAGTITIRQNTIYIASQDFEVVIEKLQFTNKKAMTAVEAICGFSELLTH